MILLHFNSCKCREIIVYMYWGKPDIFVVSFMVCLAICHLSRECRKFVNWFPSCKLTISNQRSSSIFAVYRRIIKKVLGCFVWQLVSKLQFICIEETSQTDLLLLAAHLKCFFFTISNNYLAVSRKCTACIEICYCK